MKGLKKDIGKNRWDLLPLNAINEIVKVLTFGSKKYSDNNWQIVENQKERYYAALMRHLYEYRQGNKYDLETGLLHTAHAGCCLIFLIWIELTEVKQ